MAAKKQQHLVFFHPDLGIGGAERLVVDAAVGLQKLGHKVTIFTSYCDKSHCFEEVRDGTLDVRVRGGNIFPSTLFGRFAILCAILRQLHLILQIAVFTSELSDLNPPVFIIDQLSSCIPLLRVVSSRAKILFYCHFPDKLLAKRTSTIKELYRVPFDWWESYTTGVSDVILVNSNFTKSIFGEAFPGLKDRGPRVVYPCVDVDEVHDSDDDNLASGEKSALWKDKKILLSINRFERTKGVGLAIQAYAGLKTASRQHARLVIAGGYDPRVAENADYHLELTALADSLHLKNETYRSFGASTSISSDLEVVFLLSISSSLKSALLHNATLLLYTPPLEHFGIVPLEAMLARKPVVASDKGGPTETVVDGETGWLRSVQNVQQWTDVMNTTLQDQSKEDLSRMGENGRRRVIEQFSKRKMALDLENEIWTILKIRTRPPVINETFLKVFLTIMLFSGFGVTFLINQLVRIYKSC